MTPNAFLNRHMPEGDGKAMAADLDLLLVAKVEECARIVDAADARFVKDGATPYTVLASDIRASAAPKPDVVLTEVGQDELVSRWRDDVVLLLQGLQGCGPERGDATHWDAYDRLRAEFLP